MFEKYQVPQELIPSDPRFGCGPSLVPIPFIEELLKTGPHILGTSHRKPSVKNLGKSIQEGLKEYFSLPDDYTIAMGNGGATFLFDAIGLGLVQKKATHFTCGEFSSKWYKSSKLIPWIEAEERSVEMGQGITPEDDPSSDLICATLNETSTGVQVDQFPTVGADRILAVDATSGGGQCPCDVSKTDMFFFSPQKVFASEGGLFISIMSPKARERALKMAEDKSRYVPAIMNWKTIIDNSDKHQTYNTPSVSTLFMLDQQIKLLNKIGYKEVQEDGKRRADLLYGWAEEKPYLSPFIKEAKYRSHSVAAIDVDEKIPVGDLLKRLGDEKLVYGIDSYRKLGRNQFRIALFYNIKYDDLERLTKILSHAIESEL